VLGTDQSGQRRRRAYDPYVPRLDLRRLAGSAAVAALSLAAATLLVAALEDNLGIPDASVVYLPAVVVTAIVAGTGGAVVSAIVAIVLYDYLFTQPYHTLLISNPDEWVSLGLLLFVAIVVGQLAALQRSRAELASARERQARALFQVSRALATRESTPAALPELARILRDEARMERVAIALGGDDASERIAADTVETGSPLPSLHWVLKRMPGDDPATWLRVHARAGQRRAGSPVAVTAMGALRIRIVANDTAYGSIWAIRGRDRGAPDRTTTRLLSATADQLAQVLAHDRFQAEAQAAEIARQSDALKSALLQSVSHDLRTPLATIRAAAGTLRPEGVSDDDRRASAEAIDREVAYLDRMVTNLLDLSRIEAGALRAERDVFELDDLAGRTLDRLGGRLAGHPLTVDIASQPVLVDPVFLDEALTNLVENAVRHTPAETAIRVSSRSGPDGFVRLSVEDAGPGVPAAVLPHLFEKFYQAEPDRSGRRTAAASPGSRAGTGIGLAVVRGLCEAMGGQATARRSELGGLAIDLDLPAATLPADLAVEPAAEVTADTAASVGTGARS
jgi:two-component system sensor histidine kinase KdpD